MSSAQQRSEAHQAGQAQRQWLIFTLGQTALGQQVQRTLWTRMALRTPLERQTVYPAAFMGFRFFVLTRYADVVAALRDPRLSSAAVPRDMLPRELSEGNIFYKDPPDHTRLRSLLGRAFAGPTSESLRPRVQQIADELLDRLRGHDTFDVVRDFGARLSLQVITEVLGARRIKSDSRSGLTIWLCCWTGHGC